jgi:hypothetical protein
MHTLMISSQVMLKSEIFNSLHKISSCLFLPILLDSSFGFHTKQTFLSLLPAYNTKRFSQDRDLCLIPSRFLRILRPLPTRTFCFFFFLHILSWSRHGFSCTCARIPTRSSSTLWFRPLEVSINLQPQLLASLRPTVRQREIINISYV